MKRNPLVGAPLAGALLIAMPALDLWVGSGNAGFAHAVVGLCGLVMLTAWAADPSSKER